MNDRIKTDMINAMKEKDKLTLEVVRMLKGAIQLEEINKRSELSDDDIIVIVSKQIKMRNESIVEFKKANREELVDKTTAEIEILNKYLPIQLTETEVNQLIDEIIAKVDAKVPTDMGKVMKELTPLVRGKTDMSKVNMLIKEKLSAN